MYALSHNNCVLTVVLGTIRKNENLVVCCGKSESYIWWRILKRDIIVWWSL